MTLSDASGVVKRFRRTPWRFQATFHAPPKNLRPFVRTVVSALESIESSNVTIDQVVFEPRYSRSLLSRYSLPADVSCSSSIVASGRQETEELLEAVLGDSLEFIFVPTPKPFVIYADHDEYVSFYANTKSNLNSVITPLSTGGYKIAQGYERRL